MNIDNIHIDDLIKDFLKEDMPMGDITTDNLIDIKSTSEARLIAKEKGIIAGLDVARRVFEILDENVVFTKSVEDGALFSPVI